MTTLARGVTVTLHRYRLNELALAVVAQAPEWEMGHARDLVRTLCQRRPDLALEGHAEFVAEAPAADVVAWCLYIWRKEQAE